MNKTEYISDEHAQRLRAERAEKHVAQLLAEAKAQNDYPLPCHVLLPPATRIGPGVPLSVLVTALKQRDGRDVEFSSAFKALDDLTAAQATIAKMREALEEIIVKDQHRQGGGPGDWHDGFYARIARAALGFAAEKEERK